VGSLLSIGFSTGTPIMAFPQGTVKEVLPDEEQEK
jgi:hypothetical protein